MCVVQIINYENTRGMIKDFSLLLKMITKRQMLGSKFKDGKIFEISNNFKIGFQIYTVYKRSTSEREEHAVQ